MSGETMGRRAIGFASYARPNYGLSQYMGTQETEKKTEPGKRQRPPKHIRDKKTDITTYPWPDISVERRINAPEAGRRWSQFGADAEHRARNIGRAVFWKQLKCSLITPKEMNDALTEVHGSIARDPNDGRRKAKAQDIAAKANRFIAHLALEQDRAERFVELAESSDLRQRALDPDNPAWEIALAEQALSENDPKPQTASLWIPGNFEVGQQEGVGPNGIGFSLDDTDGRLADGRRELVSGICRVLSLNQEHFTAAEDWKPHVLVVDTSPLPVDGLVFTLPRMPLDMPLKAPRAYVG